MSVWPPREVFRDRRRPHRLPRCEYRKLLQPVFFACCTSHRRPILLQRGLPAALKILLNESAGHHDCAIIAATIMPDRLHVVACVVQDGGDALSFFSEFNESAVLRRPDAAWTTCGSAISGTDTLGTITI